MKQFPTLIDGLNYITDCPVCHKTTNIDDYDADLIPIKNHPYSGTENKYFRGTLQFDMFDTDLLNVEVETGKVVIVRDQFISTFNTDHIYDGGTIFLRLGIECSSCCQYEYMLQIKLDFDQMMVTGIFLDSEILSIETDTIIHEIKNDYDDNKTIYSIIGRQINNYLEMIEGGMHEKTSVTDKVDKEITLPLIPLNLLDPKETLQRITKLIVYS
jgi:hypothetical protein